MTSWAVGIHLPRPPSPYVCRYELWYGAQRVLVGGPQWSDRLYQLAEVMNAAEEEGAFSQAADEDAEVPV